MVSDNELDFPEQEAALFPVDGYRQPTVGSCAAYRADDFALFGQEEARRLSAAVEQGVVVVAYPVGPSFLQHTVAHRKVAVQFGEDLHDVVPYSRLRAYGAGVGYPCGKTFLIDVKSDARYRPCESCAVEVVLQQHAAYFPVVDVYVVGPLDGCTDAVLL